MQQQVTPDESDYSTHPTTHPGVNSSCFMLFLLLGKDSCSPCKMINTSVHSLIQQLVMTHSLMYLYAKYSQKQKGKNKATPYVTTRTARLKPYITTGTAKLNPYITIVTVRLNPYITTGTAKLNPYILHNGCSGD